ncbi:MAG TPA: hypothetical protein VF933_00880 [Streptosporangiaceae bacterium]
MCAGLVGSLGLMWREGRGLAARGARPGGEECGPVAPGGARGARRREGRDVAAQRVRGGPRDAAWRREGVRPGGAGGAAWRREGVRPGGGSGAGWRDDGRFWVGPGGSPGP